MNFYIPLLAQRVYNIVIGWESINFGIGYEKWTGKVLWLLLKMVLNNSLSYAQFVLKFSIKSQLTNNHNDDGR